ncbi:MAG: nucleotide exchange factor GrpE [Patescibacteria group bacterium]
MDDQNVKKANDDQSGVSDDSENDERSGDQADSGNESVSPGVANCENCSGLKANAEEYKSGWQRALADYSNLKNETAKEKADWAVWSEERILSEFIPVYDNFKKAFVARPADTGKEQENWAIGIKYIMKQFGDILRIHQVEEIKTVGEKFNPVFHEALGEEESDDEEGVIVKEIDGGYTLKGKVLKVAKVILAKGIVAK